MKPNLAWRALAALSLVLLATLAPAPRAAAFHLAIVGTAFDAVTRAPLTGVCVVLGPALVQCIATTDPSGRYRIAWNAPDGAITTQQELHFLHRSAGYRDYDSPKFVVSATQDTVIDAPMVKALPPGSLPCDMTGVPTQSVYLPNVTKTLGGPNGFQAPFIVQNTGTAPTTLEASFYRFSDGALVTCRKVRDLLPGTSYADVPNNDADLPDDSQFSVVVRSFGSPIMSVVNQHQGSGERAEAMSYGGFASGATTVYLPNITRRFFGYVTPFIIQNLGAATTVATARFVPFDGSASLSVTRTIAAGRSQFVDPNSEPGLADGMRYAVTVTAAERIAVVVNTHNDAPTVARPVAYSANGVAAGGTALYAPYAAKNAAGVGRISTVVVQNLGAAAVAPALAFTPLGGGAPRSFTLPATSPGASRAFDPRYEDGDAARALCGSAATASCLADGEYSLVVSAPTGSIAASVNVISAATAMGYTALAAPAARYYLPNVTRTLGGASGWTTPILLQSAGATGATVRWYRFSDGQLVTAQVIAVPSGAGVRLDPREVSALADDTQYSVLIEGSAGSVAAIVVELAAGGDNAMIYEGFAAP